MRFSSKNSRYEYDDHYFLTDPREFIYEFFPLQPDWQLLKTPITLHDFEELPFVRSLFFRYGLYFSDPNTKAVMYTDSTGKPKKSVPIEAIKIELYLLQIFSAPEEDIPKFQCFLLN